MKTKIIVLLALTCGTFVWSAQIIGVRPPDRKDTDYATLAELKSATNSMATGTNTATLSGTNTFTGPVTFNQPIVLQSGLTGSFLAAGTNGDVYLKHTNGVFSVGGKMDGSSITNLKANAFAFDTDVVNNAATNWVLDFYLSTYGVGVLTNDACLSTTRRTAGGAISRMFWASGANRTMYLPTNWSIMSTNGMTLSGAYFSLVLTNGKYARVSLGCSGTATSNVDAAIRIYDWP